jgi:hypothetical protein
VHFCPRDVDVVPAAQNNDVGGLKLCLKVSPNNGGLLYQPTYQQDWLIHKGKTPPSRFFPKSDEK